MTDTRKYPAVPDYAPERYRTTPNKSPQLVQKRTRYDISTVLKGIAVFCLALVIFGCPLAVVLELRRSTAEASADNVALGAVAGAQIGVHDTRVSELSITPTHVDTSYPTLSPTIPLSTVVENEIIPQDNISIDNQYISDNTNNVPIIQYVDRVLEVTRIVTVVVPPTPAPVTKTPHPTWTLQPTVNMTQEYGLLDLASAKRHNVMVSWLSGMAMLLGTIFVIIITVAIIRDTYRMWKRDRIATLDGTSDTQDRKIPVNDWHNPHPLADIPRMERVIIRDMYRMGNSQRAIEREVYKSEGGAAHDKVLRVLEYYGLTPPPIEDEPE